MRVATRGFSLVELLVVIAVISLLSGILFYNFSLGSAASRDAERKSELRNLQAALELYRQDNGRYPAGCAVTGQQWSGQIGTNYQCNDGSGQYIVGLAPRYMPTLPVDPRLNGADSGYVYTTNAAGTVYKLMVRNTVESETVTIGHEFQSCDISGLAWVSCSESDILPAISAPMDRCDAAICDRTHPTYNRPNHCSPSSTQFQTSYGAWGGYADVSPNLGNQALLIERYTEDVTCDIP